MLDRFPTDVNLLIAGHIRYPRDLNSLSRVSKHLHNILTPILYRSITLTAEESNLGDLQADSIRRHSTQHLCFVRHLTVTAPFHQLLRTRCPDDDGSVEEDSDESNSFPGPVYDRSDISSSSDESDLDSNEDREDIADSTSTPHDQLGAADPTGSGSIVADEEPNGIIMHENTHTATTACVVHNKFMTTLESQLLPLLEWIPDGRLQSFSWNLGTCVPRGVIRFVSQRQPHLGYLSIINDTGCLQNSSFNLDGLDELRGLRRVFFLPGTLDSECTMHKILQQNAHSLEEIRFDRQDAFRYISQNLFPHRMKNMPPGAGYVLFRSLKRLALSNVDFGQDADEMISVLNFPQLRSLRLRDCVKVNEIFEALSRATPRLQLTCLEVEFTGVVFEQHDRMPLIMLLRSFSGLRDLFILCLPLQHHAQDFWSAVHHHKSTLQRFIYQQTTVYPNHIYPNCSYRETDFSILWGLDICQYIGICDETRELRSSLKNTLPRPKIKFLHIRQTGILDLRALREQTTQRADLDFLDTFSSVLQFASWAFGPEGLPELQVLAYGDFTYGGRQPYIAWGRSSSPSAGLSCQQITKTDTRLWELIQDNLDFLEACPEDQLLHHF